MVRVLNCRLQIEVSSGIGYLQYNYDYLEQGIVHLELSQVSMYFHSIFAF